MKSTNTPTRFFYKYGIDRYGIDKYSIDKYGIRYRAVRVIKCTSFRTLFISLFAIALAGCSYRPAAQGSIIPGTINPAHVNNVEVKEVKRGEDSRMRDDWVWAFLLTPRLREEALETVAPPSNNKQRWLRAILLTHSGASYRELRDAERLLLQLLQQLKLSEPEPLEYRSEELLNYILKLNQVLQKRKSEVVLLQRQLNARNRTIEAQGLENKALEKKINALTNIEHRMKLRSQKTESKVSQ